MANERRRSFWGWGFEGDGATQPERDLVAAAVGARLGITDVRFEPPPRIDRIPLPAARVTAPTALAPICTSEPYERALHAYGRSYRDVVRAFRGSFPNPPDLVAYPTNETELVDLLDHCSREDVAAIPFGGGTSVVGGVEPLVGDAYRGTMTIDITRFDRVLEVDERSRAVRVQAGVFGPALDEALRPHGLSVRHYPQSFEFSTVGGWIATRSSGHHATLRTHVDDIVESMRVVAPAGVIETLRVPASGAGPSPDRLFLGSEGALGVVTEAWLRVQPRPRWRSSAAARFGSFEAGAEAARALAQAGLHPSNCRLLDPTEALISGAGDGVRAVLLVAFESADVPQDVPLAHAMATCRERGGEIATTDVRHRAPATEGGTTPPGRGDAADAWRGTFLRAPYLRDVLVSMGIITETFETAVTWDRFDALDAAVVAAVEGALRAVGAWPGIVTRRFTHVYADGPAPYYTVIAPGRQGAELQQWASVKGAASDAILAAGGTITHHHAVGRDHMPWYTHQRPALFGEALAAAKARLDPSGVLNPGVLFPPGR